MKFGVLLWNRNRDVLCATVEAAEAGQAEARFAVGHWSAQARLFVYSDGPLNGPGIFAKSISQVQPHAVYLDRTSVLVVAGILDELKVRA